MGPSFAKQGSGGRFKGNKGAFGGKGGGTPGRFERRKRFLLKARQDVREAFTGKGAPVVQAVRSIDDIDSAISLLNQRLKEFFAINFPEMALENDESFARVLRQFGRREAFDQAELAKLVGESKASELAGKASSSYGAAFSEHDAEAVKALAATLSEMHRTRKELEKFISAECGKTLKNVSYLIEPLVAARLLSAAGSLEKLASMPSSTVQVIGAEKSLFKHLRTGSPPPKHGIIFNCQMVRMAKKEERGRIARALAGKIAIAAKADAFTGNFIAPRLKEQLEKALKRSKN